LVRTKAQILSLTYIAWAIAGENQSAVLPAGWLQSSAEIGTYVADSSITMLDLNTIIFLAMGIDLQPVE
jgi:hypothetical protein